MRRTLLLSLVVCLVNIHQAEIIDRCALAKLLHQEDMDGFEGYSLSDWLCLAFVESNFNISKVNENADGSFDYGIFQINSHYWCTDHQSHSENICHLECQELLSPNLLSTIRCAKIIVSGTGGMKNCMEDALFRPATVLLDDRMSPGMKQVQACCADVEKNLLKDIAEAEKGPLEDCPAHSHHQLCLTEVSSFSSSFSWKHYGEEHEECLSDISFEEEEFRLPEVD